ncbi:MAG: ferrous iron transport protein A [Clostridiales bacterium]|nr:ferrous iron transport protein A [Clostridiales bacterium]
MREKGLDRLAPYGHAKVEKILDSAAKERLISLGVNEGVEVCRLFSAPSGDPTAYLVRGSVIAIRAQDAKNVIVGDGTWA